MSRGQCSPSRTRETPIGTMIAASTTCIGLHGHEGQRPVPRLHAQHQQETTQSGIVPHVSPGHADVGVDMAQDVQLGSVWPRTADAVVSPVTGPVSTPDKQEYKERRQPSTEQE